MKKLISLIAILALTSCKTYSQVNNKIFLSPTTASSGLTFYDFSKQSQIRIDSGLSEKVSSNQKIFSSNRCDIYVKSIRDSVEVCVYFYSKDTLIINGQKIAFKNKYKP